MKPEDKAVVQQALETFKKLPILAWTPESAHEIVAAMTALHQLLEQPEPVQEPVAVVGEDKHGPFVDWLGDRYSFYERNPVGTKFYTTPPAQPEPVQELQRYSPDGEGGMEVDSLGAYVKLREKNAAQPAPVQEWMKPHPKCDEACLFQCTKGFTQFPECATTPPAAQPASQRSENTAWVGLTDEERLQIMDGNTHFNMLVLAEAKLKEKNT